jgi:uncharacterized membrane protein
MDMGSCDGQMGLSMRVCGRTTNIMEGANSIMPVETFMKESLLTIWPKDLEFIVMPTDLNTWGIGTRISNMDLEKSSG